MPTLKYNSYTPVANPVVFRLKMYVFELESNLKLLSGFALPESTTGPYAVLDTCETLKAVTIRVADERLLPAALMTSSLMGIVLPV